MGRLRHRLRMLGHLGRNRSCACCGARWRQFAEFNGRPHALCLGCGSLERHRALAMFFADTHTLPGARVLHFAPEPSVSGLIEQTGVERHLTADLEPGKADVAADITDLPFEDDEFDLIVCSHVLEHVPDDAAALSELARVCEPGGLLAVMVPRPGNIRETIEDPGEQDPEVRERRFGQHDHVRIYGPDLADRIAGAGFDVEVRRYAPDGAASGNQSVFAATRCAWAPGSSAPATPGLGPGREVLDTTEAVGDAVPTTMSHEEHMDVTELGPAVRARRPRIDARPFVDGTGFPVGIADHPRHYVLEPTEGRAPGSCRLVRPEAVIPLHRLAAPGTTLSSGRHRANLSERR